MYRGIDRVIETDILCVGGSGAGITAAIYASRKGKRVILLSKGKVGRSGNAIMAGGGFGIDGESGRDLLGLDFADPSFTKERLFDSIVKESFYLADQNMVEQYVEEGPVVVKDYLGWAERAGETFFESPPANWIASGLSFTKALVQGLREADGIDVLEDVTAVEILTADGKVSGAIALDIYSGELILIKAGAVVLGTGGYMPFSVNNTASDMTGDGVGMAYRVGAALTDMEFILSFPTAVVPEEMAGSIYPYVFEYNMRNLDYTIRDKNGDPLPIPEEIIALSRGGKLSKLVTSYYFGHAAEAGLAGPHGGFFYDYSANALEEKKKGFDIFYGRFDHWHRHGYYKGESLRRVEEMIFNDEPLEVGIGAEYAMGGVEINEKMATRVEGLYVAGEASSGVFGACRVGDGLVEMMCQGMRAGISAAENLNAPDEIDEDFVEALVQKITGVFDREGTVDAVDFYEKILAACDKGFGLIRTEEKLQEALGKILDLKADWPNVAIRSKSRKYNGEWLRWLAAENLLTCCEAGIRAAILRKESRGCHIRKDYPEVDHDRYLVKYRHRKGEEGMETEARKPVVLNTPLPKGRVDSVIAYFQDPDLNYRR